MLKSIILLVVFSIPFFGFSQEKETENIQSTDIKFSFGSNSANFRDFATSPLTYYGSVLYFSIGKVKSDHKKENEIALEYCSGNFIYTSERATSPSEVKTLNLYYSKHYNVEKWSNDVWNIRVGGEVNVTSNLRINSALQNNSAGIEVIPTLFGSIKATKDISNKEIKHKKFIFIKYRIPPRTRQLSFKLNVGLINSSYRNGYAYSGQSAVLNDTKVFDDYHYNFFSGFRMGSAVDYTVTLKNYNKIQFSYLWNAYKTGGDYDQFEMASHTLKISFLFNKKRQ